MFIGHFEIDDTGYGLVQITDGQGFPSHPDYSGGALLAVNYRIWKETSGSLALITTGTCSQAKTGTIATTEEGTDQITLASGHGVVVGDRIWIQDVTVSSGSDVINDVDHLVTAVSGDQVTLGTTLSGMTLSDDGTWALSGLYYWTHTLSTGNGYAAGNVYWVTFSTTVDSNTVTGEPDSFMVN